MNQGVFIQQGRKGTAKVQNSRPRSLQELTLSRTLTVRDGILKRLGEEKYPSVD